MNLKQNKHFTQAHSTDPLRTLRRALFSALAAISFLNVSHAAIIPPDEMVAGKSQAEWLASGWKRAYEIQWDGAHPVQDRTGASALRNQSGPVWFLGPANTIQPVNRYISVPADIILDVHIAAVACSTIEPPPFHGDNEPELRDCVENHAFDMLYCEVDGVPVANLNSFVTISPLFDFVLPPPPNVADLPFGGPAKGVGRGASVLMQFTPGSHTVHFGARYFPSVNLNNVTFHITTYERPALTIHPQPGTNLLSLSWPITTGFSLQEAGSLESTATWSAASVLSSTASNGTQFVTVTNGGARRFYRLHRPTF